MKEKKENGLKVMVCGSQKFDDQSFVHQTLEMFYRQTKGNFTHLFTSRFSGSCEFARQWVEQKNQSLSDYDKIKIVDFAFDSVLEQKNQPLYDSIDFPAYALQNDPFFKKGTEMLIAKGVNLVIAFPNQEGVLGASTRNIQRFAEMGSIDLFDCSQLMAHIKAHRAEMVKEKEVVAENEVEQPSLGFNNRHPLKR